MFNIGDLVIYSNQGICRIDDICEKTYSGITRNYYIMSPIEDSTLTIQNPVDNDRNLMRAIIGKSESEEILDSFKLPGIQWIDHASERHKNYSEIVSSGDRKEISSVLNTLMSKKYEFEIIDKKLSEHDRRLLLHIQKILFKELAITLDTTVKAIEKDINRMIAHKMSKTSHHEVANFVN
ncbi:CarD family transcriptional regulator [Bacillus sp. HNG]|uniref:CarD family transcriptional regulator n=1 Tax=Bacillus sp. HNG TaxID=2293325 RepID=UPI000E2EB671|nr:CarD family transcriptional regulator [Bacillus sp. HNG]RFB17208.1 CarD family transcriptional regulator [Bacillus sp. HNG]